MKNLTDEELISLYLHTNNDPYFELLYQRYRRKVIGRCLHFVGDLAEAEDITHDIFIRLLDSLHRFKGVSRFSTWLYRITHNHCQDVIRRQHIITRAYISYGYDNDQIAHPDELSSVDMQIQHLQRAMGQLSESEQQLLRTKYQLDVPMQQIADDEKLTLSAVKMRLKRARERLQQTYMKSI